MKVEKFVLLKKYRIILLLNVIFFIYSLNVIFGKLAANEKIISIRFLLFYGMSILLLGVFAFFWQIILKKLPLILAFSNRAIVIFWGLLWGVLFFNEKITLGKLIGVSLVIIGVILFSISKTKYKS